MKERGGNISELYRGITITIIILFSCLITNTITFFFFFFFEFIQIQCLAYFCSECPDWHSKVPTGISAWTFAGLIFYFLFLLKTFILTMQGVNMSLSTLKYRDKGKIQIS